MRPPPLISGPFTTPPQPIPGLKEIPFQVTLPAGFENPTPPVWQGYVSPSPSLFAPLSLKNGWQERYRAFIRHASDLCLEHLKNPEQDRGLVVSPIGLRETIESILLRFADAKPDTPSLRKNKILLVVQGVENRERWRKRLERLFETPRLAEYQDQDVWEKGGITVQLASIHALSQSDSRPLLDEVGLVILDKEHHIRPVLDHSKDEEAIERGRFIRILVDAGFLTPDFQIRRGGKRRLLGFTETVTSGAKGIYGGVQGLVFETTLPSLLSQGFVKKPEVRVILPKNFPKDLPVHAAWLQLTMEERVQHTVDVLVSLSQERGETPRTALYAGSRKEAILLAETLDQHPRFQGQAALMISGGAYEARRHDDLSKFWRHSKKIAIHVETMVEGVDEFQTDPVDVVFFSSAELSGRFAYVLQSVGAHLASPQGPPLLIDMGGLFSRHPDLTAFDPKVYLMEDGTIRLGSPLTRPHAPRARHEKKELKGTDVLLMDLFGEEVGRHLAQALQGLRLPGNPSRARLALELGWSEQAVSDLWEGRFLPQSRQTIAELGTALGLDAQGRNRLIFEWAKDRLRAYEEKNPIPEGLDDGAKIVLRMARLRILQRYGGALSAVEGVTPKILKRYLESGEIPRQTDQRQSFLSIIEKILGKQGVGKSVLQRQLGKGFLRDYWKPKNLEELSEITAERIEEWFEVVSADAGDRQEEIVLQFGSSEDQLASPTPFAVGKERTGSHYGQFKIRRKGPRSYEITRVWGRGASELALKTLRDCPLAGQGGLTFRADGFMGIRALHLSDLDDLREKDLNEWFKEVTKKKGKRPKEIVWQFRMERNGNLLSPIAVAVGEENPGKNYGKLTIRQTGPHSYEIIRAIEMGAERVVHRLRDSPLAKQKILTSRSDGFLGCGVFRMDDFKDLRTEDLKGWFEEVGEKKGTPQERIVLQLGRSGKELTPPTPLALGEEDTRPHYGKLTIHQRGLETYEVVGAVGARTQDAINTLRQSPLANQGGLILRSDGFLGLRVLHLKDFNELRLKDLEAWFEEVAREKGKSQEAIILQFILKSEADGRLVSFSPRILGDENPDQNYGKLMLRRRRPEFYEIGALSGKRSRTVLNVFLQSPPAQGKDARLITLS